MSAADAFLLECGKGTLAFVVVLYAMLAFGLRRIRALRDVTPLDRAPPSVSIVVPALNEERGIEAGVRSLLALEYPHLEVIAVDDRSTDATPAILARLALEDPRLRVATVRELPSGWLGKNHANALGASVARGELLLFTDADVIARPDALARAVAHLERERLDHLAVAPRIVMPGRWLAQFPLYFGLMFALYVRPWSARSPRSRAHVGVGPFNLVRASAYRAVGGHAPIRLRPDDDLKLGKLLKRHGCRQEFASGVGLLEFPWYASWRELRDGLAKNLYPGVGYRGLAVAVGAVAHVLGLALPPVAALAGSGPAQWLGIANWLAFTLAGALVARGFGTARWAGFLLPAYALAGAWLMVRSAALAIATGGIEWRGTRYPLKELRENVV